MFVYSLVCLLLTYKLTERFSHLRPNLHQWQLLWIEPRTSRKLSVEDLNLCPKRVYNWVLLNYFRFLKHPNVNQVTKNFRIQFYILKGLCEKSVKFDYESIKFTVLVDTNFYERRNDTKWSLGQGVHRRGEFNLTRPVNFFITNKHTDKTVTIKVIHFIL